MMRNIWRSELFLIALLGCLSGSVAAAERRETPVALHVILQSHLDPVWLWNREQWTDAAIATARTMCDILDDYPETHVTRGEAWIYECCEKYDPETFRRLKAHVAGGRLHVVGELVKSFRRRRNADSSVLARLPPDVAVRLEGALPAISLVSMTSFLSAHADDVAYGREMLLEFNSAELAIV